MSEKYPISDIRGRGLMVAVEFGAPDGGLTAKAGTASQVTKAAGRRNMLLLSAGAQSQSLQKRDLDGLPYPTHTNYSVLSLDECFICAGARESIRFLPPLNVSSSEIEEALHILDASLQEVF